MHNQPQMEPDSLTSNPQLPRVIPIQVLEDLRMVLQVLGQPTAHLLLLRELLDPMAGVERAKLPLAFQVLLASFATECEGRMYLDSPVLGQVLQVRESCQHMPMCTQNIFTNQEALEAWVG